MKLLIAYDGSDCAKAALDDLRVAGLPQQARAQIVTISENWMPPPSSLEILQEASWEMEALAHAQEAAVCLRSAFPQWEITSQVKTGSPGRVLLEIADLWNPDLLIVGSHGRSALGRFFLGSVSQRVVTEAHCSVRIARGRIQEPETPIRILIGIDGSAEAEAAVKVVANRSWPSGAEVCLINATWMWPAMEADTAPATALSEWMVREKMRVATCVETAAQILREAKLQVSTVTREKDPKQLLCNVAEQWGADCIFVGASGMGKLERFLLGSVSATVAARAHCSVEVVRQPR